MRKVWLPLAALVGILVYAVWPAKAVKSAPANEQRVEYSPGTLLPDPPAPSETQGPGAAAQTAPADSAVANPPLATLIPKTEDLRTEVARDPHATPKALMKFSIELFKKMAVAKTSEPAARNLLGEFRACALDREGAHSVQALCLLNAKRLAKQYPSLDVDYHSLEGQTDPRVVTIMRSLPL